MESKENKIRLNIINTQFHYILYHKGCPDGIAAAWVFYRAKDFQYNQDPSYTTKYSGIYYSSDNKYEFSIKDENNKYISVDLSSLKNKNILLLDFSIDKKTYQTLIDSGCTVFILDHHDSSLELDLSNENILIDTTRSGCQIAWDIKHQSLERPLLLDYIADRDMWKFKLPHSEFISAALYFKGYNFDMLEHMYRLQLASVIQVLNNEKSSFSTEIDNLISIGETLLKIKHKDLIYSCMSSIWVSFSHSEFQNSEKIKGLIVFNCKRDIRSDVGSILLNNGKDINELKNKEYILHHEQNNHINDNVRLPDFVAICFYIYETNEWMISLRSKNINVNDICKLYGGGGHKNAAGCQLSHDKLKEVFPLLN